MNQPEEDYMKFRSLMTAICVLAAAHIVSAAPFAYIANTGTRNVSIIDTATNGITATVALPDDNADTSLHPNAYGITVGASGQYVYVGLKDTNEVAVLDAGTNAVVKRITLGADIPGGLAVNAAETRLYVTSTMSNTLIVIDISSGAREVGRVSLHGDSLSNPEGVVLNAAGTKAYVANSTKDSIAVVATDETNNVYTRSSIIAAGAGSYPMGLALSSDGTKLYFASMNGNAGVVDIFTNYVISRSAILDATKEVPPNSSTATGTATFMFNPAKTTITVALNTTGLTNVTAAKILSGTATQNGGVMFTLSPTTFTSPLTRSLTSADLDSTYTASGKTFTDAVNAIQSGDVYVNVYTVTNVGGEIRGQIGPHMTTDFGNLSIAINPVSSEVYAPSFAMDQLFAFNGLGFPLSSSPYANATGPRGVSVNPLGTKLFVAMNMDDTVKVFDTASLTTAPASVALPVGAKPTNLGNFIGPATQFTIAASAGAGCTITPTGTVPVTAKGWTFGISGDGCKVLVNGADVGYPSTYKISPVTDNSQTISANQLAGTYYNLIISPAVTTSVNGYLVSNPAGLNQSTTTAQFLSGTSPTVNAASGFKAINWTGVCAGTPDGSACSTPFTNLGANKTFSATVIINNGGPFFNVTKSEYYQTIATATTATAGDFIKISTAITDLTTTGFTVQAKMSSQWNKDDYSQKGTYTPLKVTITDGSVIADDLVL